MYKIDLSPFRGKGYLRVVELSQRQIGGHFCDYVTLFKYRRAVYTLCNDTVQSKLEFAIDCSCTVVNGAT